MLAWMAGFLHAKIIRVLIMVKISVVNFAVMGYNIINLKCSITLVSFEPTFTLNGIPISPSGCQAPLHMKTPGEGKSKVAVTHLASLGVKRQEPTFWGIRKIKRELETTLFVFLIFLFDEW